MSLIRKYKIELVSLILIVIIFLASRLYQLTSLPIFTDEAIYIRWAQIARDDASWRFISLTDGKQPLFIWIMMIVMRFISDPLFAGRLVSVGTGIATLIGMFFLGREVFKNKWIGIISSFLYLIFPMALVYDRMALYDSMVGTFGVWSLYFTILLIRRLRLDIALILGMVIGGGVLTKSSGFFNIYLLPLSLIIINWKQNSSIRSILKWIGLAIISAAIAYMYYSILRLSPFFRIIEEKNALFVYPFNEWIKHPFTFFWGNLSVGQKDWLLTYLTLPVFLTIIASFLFYKQYFREKILLFLWFFLPFLALALFGKVLYPRFIFFMLLSLLPLAAYSLFKFLYILKNRLFFLVFTVVISFSLFSDFKILTNFSQAPIPDSDLNQYNNDWPSGGGIKETVEFLDKESKKGKVYVGTEGTFGLLPSALEIYLHKNNNVKIVGFWPIDNDLPKELIEASKKMPAYFIFYQPCNICEGTGKAPDLWPAIKIIQYQKANYNKFLTVYKINP